MIITLKSNNADGSADFGNNANDFTNHFPDSLILKKNSEIGVLNCTYNLQEGLDVVAGVNDAMSLVIPPNNSTINITIPPGSYSNEGLAGAIETAIRAIVLNTNQAGVYPSAGVEVTLTSKNALQIVYPWNPSTLTLFKLTNAYMRLVGDISGGAIDDPADDILYFKTSSTNTFASNSLISDSGAGEYRELYGMAYEDPSLVGGVNSYFGSYHFETSNTTAIEARIALSHSGLVDISNSPIQLALDGSGGGDNSAVCIFENLGGATPSKILFDPPQTAGAGVQFRILVPVQYDKNTPTTHAHAIYQRYNAPLQTWETMHPVSSSQRYTISLYDQFLFRASIKTPRTSGVIARTVGSPSPTGASGVIDRITGFQITDGSLGYILGEEVTVAGGTTRASFYVTSVSAVGEILSVGRNDWKSAGRGYTVGDNVVLSGLVSGASGALGNITAVENAITLGTNDSYADQETVNCAQPGFENLQIKVLTTNATGGILTFDITEPLLNGYTGQSLLFDPPTAGGTAVGITFAEYGNYQPSILNLQTNGILTRNNITPIFHPLALQQNIRMDTGVLGSEIGLPSTIRSKLVDPSHAGINFTGDAIESSERLQNNMLIHLDNFPIKSIHKGGQGRCVAALPLGDNSNTHAGLFQDRVYNLVYHACENKEEENYNQMRVRITDAEGNKLVGLQHPVVVNLDLRPRSL